MVLGDRVQHTHLPKTGEVRGLKYNKANALLSVQVQWDADGDNNSLVWWIPAKLCKRL